MSYEGWDDIDRRRAAFKKRIEELDKKHVQSAEELSAVLREMANLGRQEIREMISAAIWECFKNLVRETPHDTGRARAGWRIGQSPSFLPGKAVYPEFQNDGSIAAAIHNSIDGNIQLSAADVLWIYNNVEYVLALNAGWSTKQAGGFIDKFLSSLKSELEKISKM